MVAAGKEKLLSVHFELLTTTQSELWIIYIRYVLKLFNAILECSGTVPKFCKIQYLRNLDNNLAFALILFYFQGIPEAAEVAVPVAHLPANQTASGGVETGAAAGAPVSGVPNSSPLNLFPQV